MSVSAALFVATGSGGLVSAHLQLQQLNQPTAAGTGAAAGRMGLFDGESDMLAQIAHVIRLKGLKCVKADVC